MTPVPAGTPLPYQPDRVSPAGSGRFQAPPPRRTDWRRIGALIGVPLFMAACGIAVLVWVGYRIGVTPLIVGLVSAIIPVPVLAFCFVWLDRYEPAPIRNLALCLGWGASVATGGALLAEWGESSLLDHYRLSSDLLPVIGAPLAEETMKALGPVLLLVLTRRRAFSGMVDGIVYCGLSATGFAMIENILYLGGYGYSHGVEQGGSTASGVSQLIGVFIGRIVLSGFAHPLFTAMTGIGLGLAARASGRWMRWLAPVAGLLTAMILHGTWNLMSVLAKNTGNATVLLYGYFSVMMPIFFGVLGFVLWLRSWEGRTTDRILPEYVRAGWFSPPEVAALRTMGRRQAARTWAKRVAGEQGAAAMRGYQFAATRLALLRDGMHRGLPGSGDLAHSRAEECRLLDEIAWYRSVFTRDPMAPVAVWNGSRYYVTFPDGTVRVFDAPAQPVVPTPVVLAPPAFGWHYR